MTLWIELVARRRCRALIMATLASFAFQTVSAAEPQAPVRIPFVVGLTTVRASVTPRGDYESVRTIDAIDANGYRLNTAGQLPADDGSDDALDTEIKRSVRAEDQRAARKIRIYFHTEDPETFPGTVPGFSSAIASELRATGKATVIYQDVQAFFGMTNVREFKGVLARVPGPATMPMLVNGRMVNLPVVRTKGELSDGEDYETVEFDAIDDPVNPMVLRFSGLESVSKVIRIEYPETKQAPDSIESKLARNEPALVYGIYFDFARADIRKESERVLTEIATILRDHPDWKLRVDGHTDNVGNDAANLDLSKQRSAAVKAALVARFKIDGARLATGGYGESSPQATNETPEGRARNRRVELRRE